jgi:hypothetical protein
MAVKKVFLPVGVTFKGDGFYKTDSRKSSEVVERVVRRLGGRPARSDSSSGVGTSSDSGGSSGTSGRPPRRPRRHSSSSSASD